MNLLKWKIIIDNKFIKKLGWSKWYKKPGPGLIHPTWFTRLARAQRKWWNILAERTEAAAQWTYTSDHRKRSRSRKCLNNSTRQQSVNSRMWHSVLKKEEKERGEKWGYENVGLTRDKCTGTHTLVLKTNWLLETIFYFGIVK